MLPLGLCCCCRTLTSCGRSFAWLMWLQCRIPWMYASSSQVPSGSTDCVTPVGIRGADAKGFWWSLDANEISGTWSATRIDATVTRLGVYQATATHVFSLFVQSRIQALFSPKLKLSATVDHKPGTPELSRAAHLANACASA